MWESRFLETLVGHLEDDDDLVVAFSDHYVADEDGTIDEAATDAVSHLYGRDTLRPGVHKPFSRIGLVRLTVPIVVAAVMRRSAIDWDDFPAKVHAAYDVWLTYLAARTGRGAYYHPEKLTRYRVHAQAVSRTGRSQPNTGKIFCYARMSQDDRLMDLRPDLRRVIYAAHYAYGMLLLRAGRAREARHYLWVKLHKAPDLTGAIAFMVSLLPPQYARRV
jgi:hypothetical protein